MAGAERDVRLTGVQSPGKGDGVSEYVRLRPPPSSDIETRDLTWWACAFDSNHPSSITGVFPGNDLLPVP